MNKKKISVVVGVVVLTLGTVGTVFGLKYFRGLESSAAPENEPQLARVTELAPQSATVTWITSAPAFGFISYGETMGLGKVTQEEQKTEAHRVTLTALTPSTTYYYKIGVGSELFDNQGVPYSFTTPAAAAGEQAATTSEEEEEEEEEEESSPSDGEQSPDSEDAITLAGFGAAMESSDLRYDINEDGQVDGADISLFIAEN